MSERGGESRIQRGGRGGGGEGGYIEYNQPTSSDKNVAVNVIHTSDDDGRFWHHHLFLKVTLG